VLSDLVRKHLEPYWIATTLLRRHNMLALTCTQGLPLLQSLTIIIITLTLTLIACSDGVKEAKQMVKKSIGLNDTLEIKNIQTFPGDVVCLEYLVNESGPTKTFIYARSVSYARPSELYLAFFCSETPGNVLLERAGIGPYSTSNTDLTEVTIDLTRLTAALESYYHDQFFYPTAEQGLQALAAPPDNILYPQKYPTQGYLKPIPLDPWGRPYLYEEPRWGGSKGNITVTTLGANGIAGGTGEDADISTKFLAQLQHLSFIAEQ